MSGYASIRNGQKGGRPKYQSDFRFEIPEAELVVLTPVQYCLLIEKYGYDLFYCAVKILQKWFKTGGSHAGKYIGKNNYAHFRADGWLINTAKKEFIKK